LEHQNEMEIQEMLNITKRRKLLEHKKQVSNMQLDFKGYINDMFESKFTKTVKTHPREDTLVKEQQQLEVHKKQEKSYLMFGIDPTLPRMKMMHLYLNGKVNDGVLEETRRAQEKVLMKS